MNKINKIQIAIALAAILLFGGIFAFNHTWDNKVVEVAEPQEEIRPDPFANLDLRAEAVYVLDVLTNKVLFSSNAETQLPLASLTKVMTAVTARELAPKGTIITVNADDVKEEGDSGLLVGEKWRLSDILDLTLVMSSNDGAKAIASTLSAFNIIDQDISDTKTLSDEEYFISKMNENVEKIGMAQSFFLNESGLDSNEYLSGSYGSAKDMALLFDYVLKNHPDIFEATSKETIEISSLDDVLHVAKNTNENVEKIPALIASKTGFTDLANGNLVIAFEAGPIRPVIVAVLGSGINSRFEDVEKLVWASIKALQ